jgi:hypothetical protein
VIIPPPNFELHSQKHPTPRPPSTPIAPHHNKTKWPLPKDKPVSTLPSITHKQALTAPSVDLATLTTPQLSQVKKQLDDELEHLTNSFTQLRAAQAKFRECLRSIAGGVTPKLEGTLVHLQYSRQNRMEEWDAGRWAEG